MIIKLDLADGKPTEQLTNEPPGSEYSGIGNDVDHERRFVKFVVFGYRSEQIRKPDQEAECK
jgi:hypothetical protein